SFALRFVLPDAFRTMSVAEIVFFRIDVDEESLGKDPRFDPDPDGPSARYHRSQSACLTQSSGMRMTSTFLIRSPQGGTAPMVAQTSYSPSPMPELNTTPRPSWPRSYLS